MKTQAPTLSKMPNRPCNGLGFTMVELLITLTIAGILAATAIPSYSSFVANQRIKASSFELMSALTLARSEALKRNFNVVITPATGGWGNGWTTTSNGITLNNQAALRGIAFVSSPASNITYTNSGRLLAAITSFELSSSSSNTTAHRCISIDLSGRPNSKVGAC